MQVDIDSVVRTGLQARAAAAPVLHISYVKSGSYFLWSILDRMFREAGEKRSFVQGHPIQAERDAWPEFSIEQFDIDQMMVLDQGLFWQVEMQHLEAVRDVPAYLGACSHIWTHSLLCYRSWEVYPQFAKRCYLVRDPRDALVSMAHFVQTPFMRRYHPHPSTTPEAYVERELTPFLEAWCQHAGEHSRARSALDIKWLRYEDLRADLVGMVRQLASWLSLPLAEAQVLSVAEDCGLNAMRERSPQHVRSGESRGFQSFLSAEQCRRALEVAGPLMRELGYEE